ncbi:MAG: hypothetical protein NTW49_06050 [Bacteroidia bacterium]|nr:hypothetical protein [Bacteroidia bacterium]
MKIILKYVFLFLMLSSGIWISPQKVTAQGEPVSFQVFYDALSPYGTWVDSPEYGYAWIPDVAPGFMPYRTNGYWIFTDDGWTWVSNYPWGWAPFHYGRWHTDPNYGPMWVPDNEWGPGWVSWRRSTNYYGWAPIEPGVSISMAYSNEYHVPDNDWTFVRGRYFGQNDINHYYVHRSENVTIINNTTVVNNTRVDNSHNVTYNAGPDRGEVEKHVGKPISPVIIKESNKPGQHLAKDQLEIYRPPVQKSASAGNKPVPSKVANLKDIKTQTQRSAGTPSQKAARPATQKTSPSQHAVQPANQQLSQPKQTTPPKKAVELKQPQQTRQTPQTSPPKKTEEVKQPQHNNQPVKQQPSKQQNNKQLNQKPAKPPESNPSPQVIPPKGSEGVNQSKQENPPPKTDEEKPSK